VSNAAPGYQKYPDHRVDISPANRLVRVFAGDRQLAESKRALLVDEVRHDKVFYLPREDVQMTQLEATEHSTYCPFKGHASYFSVIPEAGDSNPPDLSNSVWSYTDPYDECLELRDYLAFYTDRLNVVAETLQP
jgi:uncharacterized protein (DUF427 family)